MKIFTFKRKKKKTRKTLVGRISMLKKPQFITEMNEEYRSVILGA